MKYRTLGKTQFKVSEIGFGCWAIGGSAYGPVRDEDSVLALEKAFEHGINFFDTADIYGHGHSEKIFASVAKSKKREDYIVATKAGHDFYHGAVKKNFKADYLRMACEKSLERLRVDAIDLYQLHNPQLDVIKSGEALDALTELKRQGKIRAVGVSVVGEETALACLQDPRVDSIQVLFNLIDQRMCFRIFPIAEDKNVGVIVREPLACGILTGKYAKDSVFTKDDHRHGWSRQKKELDSQKIEKLKSILATQRFSMARASLEYVLEYRSVSTVIPGMKTKEQVAENVMASEDPLLRSQESSLLRDFYQREPLFKQGLD